MKQFVRYILFLLFVASALHGSAFGNDLRCGSNIISVGARMFDVIVKCGEPAFRYARYETRIKRDFFRDIYPPRQPRESEKYREPLFVEEIVAIDEWVYNPGPRGFVRYLTFENGILVRIELGDYGY